MNTLVDCFKNVSSDPQLYLSYHMGKVRAVPRAERGPLQACFTQAIGELKQQQDSPLFQQQLVSLRQSTIKLQARFEARANSLCWKVAEIYHTIVGLFSFSQTNPVTACIREQRKAYSDFIASLDDFKYEPQEASLAEARKAFDTPIEIKRKAYAEPKDITIAKDNFRWRNCKGASFRVQLLGDLQEIIKMLSNPNFQIQAERLIIDIKEGTLSQHEFQLLLQAIKEQKSCLYVFENLNVQNGLSKESITTLITDCQGHAQWLMPAVLDLKGLSFNRQQVNNIVFTFPNTVKLDFAHVTGVEQETIKALLTALPLLEELDLTKTLLPEQVDALLATFIRSCLHPKALKGGSIGQKELAKTLNACALLQPQIGPDQRLLPRQLEEAFLRRPHLIAADFSHGYTGSMQLDSFLTSHPYLELLKLAPAWTRVEKLNLTYTKPALVRQLLDQLPTISCLMLGEGCVTRSMFPLLAKLQLKELVLPKSLEKVWQNFLLLSSHPKISPFAKEALTTALIQGAAAVNLEPLVSEAGLEEISDDFIVRLGEVLEALDSIPELFFDQEFEQLMARIETKLLPLKANVEMKGRPEALGLLQRYPQAFPNILFLIEDERQRRDMELAQALDRQLNPLQPDINYYD